MGKTFSRDSISISVHLIVHQSTYHIHRTISLFIRQSQHHTLCPLSPDSWIVEESWIREEGGTGWGSLFE